MPSSDCRFLLNRSLRSLSSACGDEGVENPVSGMVLPDETLLVPLNAERERRALDLDRLDDAIRRPSPDHDAGTSLHHRLAVKTVDVERGDTKRPREHRIRHDVDRMQLPRLVVF